METIRLPGRITEDGQLEVELPAGLPSGEVEVAIELPAQSWSDDELHKLMQPEPLTGSEIVAAHLTGGWKDGEIDDGAAWVNEQRRRRKEARGW